MKRKGIAAAAGTLALSLAVGGVLWGGYHAQAAEETTTSGVAAFAHKLGFGGIAAMGEKLAAYLKLDEATLQEKLQTSTVAEIAEEQGVSRETMKAQIVQWITESAPDTAEKVLDSKGGLRGGHGGFRGIDSSEIAGLLGITTDELQTALRSGTTLSALATEKGVDVQKIIDAIVAEMTAKLDEKLAAGSLTQEQYDAQKAGLADRAKLMVEGQWMGKGFGGGKRGGGRGWSTESGTTSTDAAVSATDA